MVRQRSSSLDPSARYTSGSNLTSTVTSSLSSHWGKKSGGSGIYGTGTKSGAMPVLKPISRTYSSSRISTTRHRDPDLDLFNGNFGVDSAASGVVKYKFDTQFGNGRTSSGGSYTPRKFTAAEIPDFPADDEDEVDIRRRVRQKLKKAHSAEPSSVSAKSKVIYGRTSDMVKMRDRMEQAVRTSSSVDRDFAPWEADGSAQVRGRTREVYSYEIDQPRQPVEPRAMSVEALYYTSDLELDPPSTRLNVVPLRSRSTSLTRAPGHHIDMRESVRRAVRRAHSVTCFEDEDYVSDYHVPRKKITRTVPHHINFADLRFERPQYIAPYTEKDVRTTTGDYRFHISELEKDRRKGDISTYVLPYDEKFEPDSVDVKSLGDGRRQVTYSRQTLSGHAADPREANAALDNVVRRTKFMQDSMSELEKFVRRNRSLFPEDTTIYQDYKFYLLSEEELLKIGERPDAEVYGVKIIEKLVVPAGTEIAHLLKRFLW